MTTSNLLRIYPDLFAYALHVGIVAFLNQEGKAIVNDHAAGYDWVIDQLVNEVSFSGPYDLTHQLKSLFEQSGFGYTSDELHGDGFATIFFELPTAANQPAHPCQAKSPVSKQTVVLDEPQAPTASILSQLGII